MNRNKMLCCPFHDYKTPGMQVYPNTNTVFCFSGNCKMNGKAMDTIEFIQQKEGVTKHEATKKAESLLNGAAITTKPAVKPIIQTENLNDIPALSLAEVFPNYSRAFTAVAKPESTQKAGIFTTPNWKRATTTERITST